MTTPLHAVSVQRQRGVTLVELITSIVVISLAASALLGILGFLSNNSGMALAQTQAQSVADLYLTEALSKPFIDPDGVDGETARTLFDDIDDYNGLDTATATDQAGVAAGSFRVRVAVVPDSLVGIPATALRRVDVRVEFAADQMVLATGYRARYP
jgi:MSHA pilin protein MshD